MKKFEMPEVVIEEIVSETVCALEGGGGGEWETSELV